MSMSMLLQNSSIPVTKSQNKSEKSVLPWWSGVRSMNFNVWRLIYVSSIINPTRQAHSNICSSEIKTKNKIRQFITSSSASYDFSSNWIESDPCRFWIDFVSTFFSFSYGNCHLICWHKNQMKLLHRERASEWERDSLSIDEFRIQFIQRHQYYSHKSGEQRPPISIPLFSDECYRCVWASEFHLL